MPEVTGGCYCGAIRYRILATPSTAICYCGNCRRAIGAQSVAWVVSDRDLVQVVQGEPTTFTAPNGAAWSFCAVCGSTLFWEPDGKPGVFTVTTGTLDTPEAFPPVKAAWEDERLPWDPPCQPTP
jgi:hypothetical protein